MTAWKLFDGDIAHVSTAAFHEHRERAPHLEQEQHRGRLEKAAEYVRIAARHVDFPTVSDLGCGDGGLLSLLQREITAWGYDFQPSNVAGWKQRGVTASQLDVFGRDSGRISFGSITVVTEVLEHLTNPQAAVAWIADNSRYLVASSPWVENADMHDECHAWAFDPEGYYDLITGAGFKILLHEQVGPFQTVLAEVRS